MLADRETQRSQRPGKTETLVSRVEPTSVRDNTPLPFPRKRRSLTGKRVMDVCVSLAALLFAAPLLLLASVLVKLASRGPVFYSQTRLGLHGRPFTIYKIRTMIHDCERMTGARWASSRDPRITLVGRFLRRTHIDELPQLWNVLRGEMSLVGPRPERPEFVPQLEKVIPRYRERLQVLPGVTGLAQVQLPPDTDLASVRRKLAYDLYYVKRLSWWLDLRILLATAGHVVGLPYSAARTLFRMPHGQAVEVAYQQPGGDVANGSVVHVNHAPMNGAH